ncbi:phage tail tape measure protein [uncultured Paraglaciecola sp.]|uniref:phage tail tape measure protein n=1 Tax=uncultured Paraglaciecola sp. TaxID=1765024 RepID=UPI002609114E|nr:phage tail tape measure protein [uncultured Paraglaciecola sp.]
MADTNMRLNLVMGMVDKLTAPIQKVTTQTTKAGDKIKATGAELKKLGAMSKDIEHFRKLKTESTQTSQALDKAQSRVSRLAAEMQAAEKPTAKMTREFKAAQKEALKLKNQHEAESAQLQKMRTNLQQAGVSTKNLNGATSKIRKETERYNAQLKAQQKELDGVVARQEKMSKLSERNSNMKMTATADAVGVGAAMFGIKKLVDASGEIGSAQGEIGSLGIDAAGIDAITKKAKEFSDEWAGTTTSDFIKASYDIKSGISSLSDAAVGEFTKIAALTATGTKSTTSEMTSLFATGYGIYRKQFSQFAAGTIEGWDKLSEEERNIKFGEYFSSGISNSVRQFKTDGAQMSAAISNLGATATSANVPFSEQLSILGQLQATMSGSKSATKYRAFLGKAAEAGDKLGLSFTDANDQLLSMPDILGQLRNKYGETIDAVEAQELKKAFGTDEAVSMIQLLYPEIDTLNGNISAMDKNLKGGMGTTKEMAESIGKGTSESFQILSQRVATTSAAVGDLFAPAAIMVVDVLGQAAIGLRHLIEAFPFLSQVIAFAVVGLIAFKTASIASRFAFASFSDALIGGRKALTWLNSEQVKNTTLMVANRVKTLASTVATVAMTAAQKAQAIATNLTSSATLRANALMAMSRVRTLATMSALVLFTGTQKALAAGTVVMTTAQWALNAAFLANPIGLVIAGVMALIAVVALVVKYWEPLGTFFSGLWDRVKSVFSSGWEFVKSILMFSPIGLIVQAWDPIKGFFGGLWDGLKSTFSMGWEFIKSILMFSPIGLVMQAWDPLTGFFSSLWDGVKSMFSGAMDWIKSVILSPIETIKNTLGSAWDMLFGGGDVEVAANVKKVAEQVPAVKNPAAILEQSPIGAQTTQAPTTAPVVAASGKASVAPSIQYGDIIVHAAPGMDAEAVALEVRRQLDERDRQASRRGRTLAFDT